MYARANGTSVVGSPVSDQLDVESVLIDNMKLRLTCLKTSLIILYFCLKICVLQTSNEFFPLTLQ